ncbi:gamma-aminobutyric acid type B receptor subunit 2-like [Acropora muricata]|uniref:gamma-aminobutyric acid type B receptor subunit 2-like n=1 Tax=Acropora muricata TaxID=159855 RepID=UPI0034E4C539
MFALILCFVLLINASLAKIPLTIGGVFDIDTKEGLANSAAMIPIVRMAIRDVNACPKTLTDYELELDIKDAKCTVGDAIHVFTEFIREKKKKLMILGPGCSESAEPLARGCPYYNLVQVAIANANPALSCKNFFPTFMRTIPPEHFQNQGRVAMTKLFKWKRVAVLREALDTYQGLANDLVKRLKKDGVTVSLYESFEKDPELQIEALKKKDLRVVFGIFSEKAARRVICVSYRKWFYGPKVVWILMAGGYQPKWWTHKDVNCTEYEMRSALGNHLSTEALMIGTDKQETVAGKTVQELYDEYLMELSKSPYKDKDPHRDAAFAYDAVWTIALTLNKSITVLQQQNMSLEEFDYNNTCMRKTFMKYAKTLSFQGMSGLVEFYKNSDRLSLLNIDQLQGNEYKRLGTYSMAKKVITAQQGQTALWEGNKPPKCQIKKLQLQRYLPKDVVHCMDSLFALGIVLSTAFLCFNFNYRNVRIIRMSSPNLNNIIILGCILIYASGILIGIDEENVSAKVNAKVCQASTWVASFGFTMAFGALFSKTWRVHRIFLKKTQRMIIQDYQLILIVVLLLIVDTCILLTWQLTDPLFLAIRKFPTEIDPVSDIAVYPFQTYCTSNNESVWMGLVFGYKGFLLVFCTYLAWETRKVHIPALNDSKQIGFAVYNIVVPCAIAIPLLNFLKSHTNLVYALSAVLVIFCTTVTQCLIFVPKIVVMMRTKGDTSEYEKGSISSISSPSMSSTVAPVSPKMVK